MDTKEHKTPIYILNAVKRYQEKNKDKIRERKKEYYQKKKLEKSKNNAITTSNVNVEIKTSNVTIDYLIKKSQESLKL